MILRPGFPPADENVRDWLLRSKSKVDGFMRAGAFLCALFVVLLDYLRHIDDKIADIKLDPNENSEQPDSIAAKFRRFMSAGQTFSSQGEPRRKFYDEVLLLADEVRHLTLRTLETISHATLYLPALVAPATLHSSSKANAIIPRPLI